MWFTNVLTAPYFLKTKCLIKISHRKKKKLQYLERKPHDQSFFHAGPLSWSNWNLEMLAFWREENRATRRKTLEASRKPTTNSTTYDTRLGPNPCQMGGRRALLPLRHHSPLNNKFFRFLLTS